MPFNRCFRCEVTALLKSYVCVLQRTRLNTHTLLWDITFIVMITIEFCRWCSSTGVYRGVQGRDGFARVRFQLSRCIPNEGGTPHDLFVQHCSIMSICLTFLRRLFCFLQGHILSDVSR